METYQKTQIAYFFSNEYRQNFSYLDINNFDSTDPPAVTKLIAKVSNVITNNSVEKIQRGQVFHYLSNYKELPLWVLINKMSLGETYHLVDVLQTPIKTKILEEIVKMYNNEYRISINYNSNDTRNLSEVFKFINDFQNFCAHNARLFDCIIILGLFLSRNDYKKLINQIGVSLEGLQKHLPTNTYNMVLIQMGFPKNLEQELSLP